MPDMTQDSESRRPRTPMEKARAAARPGTGTETGTAAGGTPSGEVAPGGDERTGPVAGAAGHREAGAVGTAGAGAAGTAPAATGSAGAAGRDAGLGTTATGTTATEPGTAAGRGTADGGGHGSPLLPRDECDDLASRMQHAVVGFVDGPRDAVAEADHVLEELAARFTDAVNQRRRTLRGSWQLAEGGKTGRTDRTGTAGEATGTDTEQLRLALRDYRELTERLLHV
ncbi:hypothetical protein ACFY30_13815 [Streptomyces sp. NPDC000345]|uniref:hypothetical protein n=1 Tax=Streptomyces sp. NPDC000345 TaxID=3364537 RepID=UPI00368FFD04